MATLVIHDTPIKSGYHLQILESIFAAHEAEFDLAWVFEKMSEKELKKIKPHQWLEESDELLELSEGYERILCLGSIAPATIFQSDHTLPVTRVRGRGFTAPNGKFTVCSYSPTTVVKDTDFFRDLAFDIEKLLTNDGPLVQPEIEVLSLETREDLKLLRDLNEASFVACDIETTHFNPYHADILGIGFCALTDGDEGYVLVIPQKKIGAEVLKFLKGYKGTMVFHNAMFDIQHLWKKFGRFDFHHLADTMLMNWCLDERPFNRYRSHGLDLLSRLHFDAPPKSLNMGEWLEEYFRVDVGERARRTWVEAFCEEHAEKARTEWRKWYQELKGEEPDWRGRKVGRDISVSEVYEACLTQLPKEMQRPPTKEEKEQMWEDMMRYMGVDAFNTARLFPLLKEKMDEESPRLWDPLHEKYLIPATKALANMRLTGARVDLKYLREMKKVIEKELERDVLVARALVQEHTAHPKGPEFNPNSSKQVEEVLYDKEKGLGLKMPKGVGRYAYKRDVEKLTTNADTLKVLSRQVAKKRPAIAKLINLVLQYRVKSKIASTYVDGILERVDDDERIRGDFNLHGTATGRTSSSNPNLQNIPDASHVGFDVRKAYISSPNWVLLEADYSQLELRVAGLFSQDEVLLEAYRNGADIHQEVAYLLWNKPKDQITKYERYLAKCMNFGVIYGRGARSIATGPEMDNLVEMSGRSWNNTEIDTYFAKFKKGYQDLFKWMEEVKRDSMQKRYVESPLGNRRRFDCILNSERGHIERQTVNSPIQGFAAQMTIHALVQLDKKFDPEKQRIIFTVHDSIMCECVNKKPVIKETANLIKETMENEVPEDVIMPLPALTHSPHRMGDRLAYNLPFVADVVFGPNWSEAHEEVEHAPAVKEEAPAIA